MERSSTASRALWSVDPEAEVTLEANPTSVEAERFAGYRAAGVNRVSLGVQALDDASLKALGRMHTAEEALAALAHRQAEFRARVLRSDLCARGAGPGGVACRSSTAPSPARRTTSRSISSPSRTARRFAARHAAGKLTLPDAQRAEEFYLLTQELCEAAGLPAYEISNHARPGAESRHNLLYWLGHDYAGIGAGAHSRITLGGAKHALATRKSPEAWLEAVTRDGNGIEQDEVLTEREAADEYLLMGLRLAEGIDVRRLRLDTRRVASLERQGLLTRQGNHLAATRQGRVVLDRLILELAA